MEKMIDEQLDGIEKGEVDGMSFIDKVNKEQETGIKLEYKPMQRTPELLERQYEEECYKKYGIEKHHKFVTK